MKFTEFGFNASVEDALEYMGFEEATPIQEQAIPHILDGNDLIACAQTGTGKTAAFVLPILDVLSSYPKEEGVAAVILAPTRELALQIEQQIQGFSYFVDVSSIAIYGGGDGIDFTKQGKALDAGVDIVVATPGKLLSHLQLGSGNFKKLEFLVLDEADRMLDMGFRDDIQRVMSYFPENRQNILFSATMPPKIRTFAKDLMNNNPAQITLALSKPAEKVKQGVYLVYDKQKDRLIHDILKQHKDNNKIIIFSSRKRTVIELTRYLKGRKWRAEAISSDLEQKDREAALQRFKTDETQIVVATDVISRGIDIKEISLVINYDIPKNAEEYVHRVGRTARADAEGEALTLVNEDDMPKMDRIERLIEKVVDRIALPEHLGEGPEWKVPERRGRGPKGRNKKTQEKGRGRKSERTENKNKYRSPEESKPKNHETRSDGKQGDKRNKKRKKPEGPKLEFHPNNPRKRKPVVRPPKPQKAEGTTEEAKVTVEATSPKKAEQ